MYKFGKLHNSSNELVYDPVIYDKYEFILVSILLKYLLGLERLTIKTKDILSEEVDEIGSVESQLQESRFKPWGGQEEDCSSIR